MDVKNNPKEIRITRILFLVVFIISSILLICSFVFMTLDEYNNAKENAKIEAASNFNKDILYRRWATIHGGVYVPATSETPPNENLKNIKDRDITTPSGVKLTLINPAYMTRQVYSVADSEFGIKSHITSLKPIRQQNKADQWESSALKLFESGKAKEYYSIAQINGNEYLRYMHSFITEKKCLKCHESQGYKEGDVRGGISVSIPMEKYNKVAGQHSIVNGISHISVWLLFASLLFYSYKLISREILNRISANQKVAESEERYKSTFYISPDSINISSFDGSFVDINDGFTRITGYAKEDVIGKTSLDINLWVNLEERDVLLKVLQEKGLIENHEALFRLKNGDIITGLMSAQIINFNGLPHILSITRDISERKLIENELLEAKEKAEESDRLKSTFLANMSHEIRSPMNGILGFAQLLDMDDVTSEEKHEYVQFIKKGSNNLINIINDILEISKIEANQLTLSQSEGDINKLLFELHSTYANTDDVVKKEKFDFVIGKTLLERSYISADHSKLRQILNNLISNAVKFTDSGKVEIGVEVYQDDKLQFYISDSGIGIKPDKMEIIFERFRQGADEVLNRRFGGSGLGLAIAKGLVELMNGTIKIESTFGKGTTVYFTIPYYPIMPQDSNIKPANKLIYDWSDKTILLIEDDEFNVKLILKFLERTKAKYIVAYNGSSAIEMYRNNPAIDILLLDIQLPDIDGYSVAKKLIEINPKAMIIAQTAFAYEENRTICYEAGCSDFIAKPLDREKFLATIDKYMK